MNEFSEINGVFHVESVPLTVIAEKYGTPTYVYSAASIRNQYNKLRDIMLKTLPKDRQPLLCYACKANSNIGILKLLQSLGSGLEIISEGELFRGLKAGFDPSKIITTSFGKSEDEIKACLRAGIRQFNIEADNELENINRFAGEMGKTAKVVFRINPNISGGGHSKISTGRKEDKFGNSADDILDLYKKATTLPYLEPIGLSIHIGSQVSNVEAFKPGFEKLAEVTHLLRKNGYKVTSLDIGGGFPIVYNDEKLLDFEAYAQWVRDIIVPLDTEIQMEPGRYMVGNAGVLLARTQYIKKTPSREFLVLDAGMNDLIRPTLYEAYHGIRPVLGHNSLEKTYDVVGPICESGDYFAKGRSIKEVNQGDLVVIQSAGAYGFSMASNYNSRPLPAEVMVDGDKVSIIRKRQSIENLIQGENIPDWLCT